MIFNTIDFNEIKGLLIDINGTLYYKDKPIDGAIKAVSRLIEMGLKLLFVSNTDSKLVENVWKTLLNYGFNITKDQIFTPINAIKKFLSSQEGKKSYFVVNSIVKKEFGRFNHSEPSELPDYVIIGDFRDDWDVNRLNKAFNYVLKGAELLGTQGNTYFLDKNGDPVLDTGTFVRMIARAANVDERIFGKPSKLYFQSALKRLNLKNEQVLIIGDDINSDVLGAQKAGIKGILVRTGKGERINLDSQPYKNINSLKSFPYIVDYF